MRHGANSIRLLTVAILFVSLFSPFAAVQPAVAVSSPLMAEEGDDDSSPQESAEPSVIQEEPSVESRPSPPEIINNDPPQNDPPKVEDPSPPGEELNQEPQIGSFNIQNETQSGPGGNEDCPQGTDQLVPTINIGSSTGSVLGGTYTIIDSGKTLTFTGLTTPVTHVVIKGGPNAATYSFGGPVTSSPVSPPLQPPAHPNPGQIPGISNIKFCGAPGQPNLTIAKVAQPSTVSAGDPAEFKITIGNSGTAAATNVTVSDQLLNSLTWTVDSVIGIGDFSANSGQCTISGTQLLTCSFGTLAVGQGVDILVRTAVGTPTRTTDCANGVPNTAFVSAGNATTKEASASITVQCPTITVTKVGNGPKNAGEQIQFTITLTVGGTGTARGVDITDSLPNGGSPAVIWAIDSGGSRCSLISAEGSQALDCQFGDLEAGETRQIVLKANTTAANCGTLDNTVRATADNATLSDATASIVVNCPNVSILKSTDTPIIELTGGDTYAKYTIMVSNSGTGLATGVRLVDNLPIIPGATWTKFSDTAASADCAPDANGEVDCTFDVGGTARTIVYRALIPDGHVAACGVYENTATVTLSTAQGGTVIPSQPIQITVKCAPGLTTQVHKDGQSLGDSGSISLGEPVTDVAYLAEKGGLGPVTGSIQFYWCGPEDVGAGCLEANALPHGNAMPISSNSATSPAFTPAQPGRYCFLAVYTPADGSNYLPTSHTNADTECFNVLAPDVSIEKKESETTVSAGESFTFTITVSNAAGAGTARNAGVIDQLPRVAGVTYSVVLADTTLTGCEIDGTNFTNFQLACDTLDLGPGQSRKVTILVSTTAGQGCGSLSNTASVSYLNPETTKTSNTVTVTINCANLQVTKVGGDPITLVKSDDTGTGQFTFEIKNTGLGTATNAKIVDALPGAGERTWSLQSVTPDGGAVGTAENCQPLTSGTLDCTFPSIPYNGTITIVVTTPITNADCDGIVNPKTGVSLTADGVTTPINAPQDATITVNCAPKIVVEKSGNPNFQDEGRVLWNIIVRNEGSAPALNVTLEDVLPFRLLNPTFGSSTGQGCQIVEGTGDNAGKQVLTCSWEQINPGNLQQKQIALLGVPENPANCGPFTNIAVVTVGTEDLIEASATITILCPDVEIKKIDGVEGSVTAGNDITYTITVRNSGDGTAKNVIVTDTLDTNTTYVVGSANIAPSIAGQMLTWNLGDIVAGATPIVITYRVTTEFASCPSVENNATVAADNEPIDRVDGKNSGAVETDVVCPDLSVAKVAEEATVTAPDSIAFIITISNPGAVLVPDVPVRDVLPNNAGLNWTVSSPADGCSIVVEEIDGADRQVLVCELDVPAATDSGPGTVAIRVTAPTTPETCGAVVNFAVTIDPEHDPNDDNNTAGPVTITVLCPDLGIDKSGSGPVAVANGEYTFTIEVSNTGDGQARDVQVTDLIPAGTEYVSAVPTPLNAEASPLVWNLGTIEPNATKSISLTVRIVGPEACPEFTNTARVTGGNEPAERDTDDPQSGFAVNVDSHTVDVNCADMAITKDGPAQVIALNPTPATYTITVRNLGPTVAFGVVITDTLPANIEVLSISNGGVLANGVITWEFKDFAVGSIDLTVTFRALLSACAEGTMRNSATVTASNEFEEWVFLPPGPNDEFGANLDSVGTDVICPDLTVEKTDGLEGGPITAGEELTYTIIVTNQGPGRAFGVTVTDTLPANVTFVSATGGIEPVDGVLTWTIEQLLRETSATFTVTVLVTTTACEPGEIVNTATVAGVNEDPALDGIVGNAPGGQDEADPNNSDSVTTPVLCPDIQVVKTVNAPSVALGDTITFTITLTNIGQGEARNVQLSDNLSGTRLTWTVVGCEGTTSVASTLTCTFPTIPAGGTRTVTLSSVATAQVCGAMVNVATAAVGNERTTTLGNNTSTDRTFVNCPEIRLVKEPRDGEGNIITDPVVAGTIVTYTYEVTNIGNVPLFNVTVTDDNGTPGDTSDDVTRFCTDGPLAPNASVFCQVYTRATTIDDVPSHRNVAVVIGYTDDPRLPVEDEDDAVVLVLFPVGEVQVIKFGPGDDPVRLNGACFVLLTATEAGPAGYLDAELPEERKERCTGERGQPAGEVLFAPIQIGTWYLRETQAPEGYILLPEDREVIVTASTRTTIEVVNAPVAAAVQVPVYKLLCETDPGAVTPAQFLAGQYSADCRPGAGVAFDVTQNGEPNGRYVTGEDGATLIDTTALRRLVIVEDVSTAPDGYLPREGTLVIEQVTENSAGVVFVNLRQVVVSPSPSPSPTAEPTAEPTASPTPKPTVSPSPKPTDKPSPKPTVTPTPKPSTPVTPVTPKQPVTDLPNTGAGEATSTNLISLWLAAGLVGAAAAAMVSLTLLVPGRARPGRGGRRKA